MQFSSKRPRAEGVIIQDDGDAHGDQIWPQSGSDLPEMGQFREFFQIRFSTFWLSEPKCTESDLKNSRICPFWANLTHFGPKSGQREPI